MKKIVNPRMVGLHQLVRRVDGYIPVDQHGNAAADGKQGREIVRDDDDGNAEDLVELPD